MADSCSPCPVADHRSIWSCEDSNVGVNSNTTNLMSIHSDIIALVLVPVLVLVLECQCNSPHSRPDNWWSLCHRYYYYWDLLTLMQTKARSSTALPLKSPISKLLVSNQNALLVIKKSTSNICYNLNIKLNNGDEILTFDVITISTEIKIRQTMTSKTTTRHEYEHVPQISPNTTNRTIALTFRHLYNNIIISTIALIKESNDIGWQDSFRDSTIL